MRLDWTVRGLTPRTPLRISRSVMARRDAVRVVVEHDGVRGHGEVMTSVFHGLDVERITVLLREFRALLADFSSPEALIADLPGLDFPSGVPAVVQQVFQDARGSFDEHRPVLDQVARTAVRLRGSSTHPVTGGLLGSAVPATKEKRT